jgi:hypothetical protein
MEGFVRPESIVLPEGALVPSPNVISPPPNQFTHEALRDLPYYFAERDERPPDGTLPVGTAINLLRREGEQRCRVVDGRGLYVSVDADGLRPL